MENQLVMLNNCISVKNFKGTRTIYSKNDPVEIFMGSDTNNVIDRLFETILEIFQRAIKTSIKEANLHMKVLDYIIIFRKSTLKELNHT